MFVFFWPILFSSLRSSSANTGTTLALREHCPLSDFCISLPEGEITAEAGLCVVIPCSFTTNYWFKSRDLVWYKCDPAKDKCDDSDIIFSTERYTNIQSEFRGRVSLLEPDVRQKTCSFIINDLKESDSGSYQFRVNGELNRRKDGFTYPSRATVSVKGLSQKPILMIPPLTERQQTTLTCTAPGLCSGSKPEITWMWMGAGGNSSQITENISDVRIENTDVLAQRHSSTLTFNPSAEHHGTTVTCKVRFTGNVATEETVTLNVTHVKEVRITEDTKVREGDMLSLTCGIESFPPSVIKWTRFSELITENGTETHKQNNTDTPVQEGNGKVTLSISNVTAKDSGLYICTVQYLNNIWNKAVDVKVKYVREPALTGNTTVEKGDTLNLTCRAESFPPALITWTKLRSSTSLANGVELQSNNGSATLIIPDVTAEDSAQYICTVQHLNTTKKKQTEVTVTWFSKILNSGCELQSELLTCVCISEGSPLPSITWPLLKNHNEHSVITSVSKYTINSTVILTVKDVNNTVVECVSRNENGETRRKLRITAAVKRGDPHGLSHIPLLTVAVLSLIGNVILIICVVFLRKSREEVKPNPEDRTYMSLQTTDRSLYDVIHHAK
ncbi:hemicentin-1-like isoform X1 [Echeneis naucrates]|uniref:hemicentin-1-like isoform X1 n=1 Tax=Echeneis naucrates TaxID=173247 RepID=UPI0011141B1E|nr:hemicentin-1-like isoform X1 [Echeneis naucrates]XP_029359317.1 hemicentin-1-like isoform X1 [Echeneis naucrates]